MKKILTLTVVCLGLVAAAQPPPLPPLIEQPVSSHTNIFFNYRVVAPTPWIVDTNILSECLAPTNIVLFTMCPVTDVSLDYYKIHWGEGQAINWRPSIWSSDFPCEDPISSGGNWVRSYTTNTNIGQSIMGGVSNLIAGVTYFFAAEVIATNGLEGAYSNELQYSPPYPKLSKSLSLTVLPDGSPQITTKVCPNTPFQMLWSTDLITWNTLVSTNTDEYGNIRINDTSVTRGNMRLYKLKL